MSSGGNFKTEPFVNIGGGDSDLSLPRDIGANAVNRPSDFSAGVSKDQINEAVGGFVERMNIDAALVAVRGIGGEAEAL